MDRQTGVTTPAEAQTQTRGITVMIITYNDRVIRIFEDRPTRALIVEIDGQRLRGQSFVWERDATAAAKAHIDAQETQS
jgi:hypothetical protein